VNKSILGGDMTKNWHYKKVKIRHKMSLELILGPMFAGKSSAILQIVNRHKSIGRSTLLISHSIDSRYSSENYIINHDGSKIPCCKTNKLLSLLNKDLVDSKLVIIEEAQFFSDLYMFVLDLVENQGKDVIVVGLDGDADRKPFGQILELVPLCDKITKLKAFCKLCSDGTNALFTFCKKKKDEQVCVGGEDLYMPLCRQHYLAHSIL
jgi:thymidine kinase